MNSSPVYRDLILKCGGLHALLPTLAIDRNISVQKPGIAAISKIIMNNPPPKISLVIAAVPYLTALLRQEIQEMIPDQALWSLHGLSMTREGAKYIATPENTRLFAKGFGYYLLNSSIILFVPAKHYSIYGSPMSDYS